MDSLLEQDVHLSPAALFASQCGQGKSGNTLALPVDALRMLALQVCSLGLPLEKMCARVASPSAGRCWALLLLLDRCLPNRRATKPW